jgi:hypothetical protein
MTKLLSLARTRNGLLVVVGLLVLLNGVRLINGKYADILQGVESKQSLLGQYRMSTKDIDSVRVKTQQLEVRKTQFETHLFRGETEKDVTSAMQIKLQEVLGRVGMNPESLSPVSKGGKDDGKPYGEVIIKIRLGGTIEGFVKFLAELYKMDYLFRVENVTVKPLKKDEVKIFLELIGYYRLNDSPKDQPSSKDAPKKDLPAKETSKHGDSGKKGTKEP